MRVILLIGAIAALAGAPGCASPRTSTAIMRSPVETVEPWFFERVSGSLIRTRSYRLFTTETDKDLIWAMPEFLERALDHYTTALGPLPRPDLKLDTFLMADREQWASLTRQVMGANADLYLRIRRGGFSSGGRALLFTIGHRDTLAIAAHEGWHQYTQRTFRHELPVWLEEGIAAYMEGFTPDPINPDLAVFNGWANLERFEQLSLAAREGRLMPLSRLLEVSPGGLLTVDTDSALTYYAQSWALVHFLRDGRGGAYRESLSWVLADAAAGRLRQRLDQKLGPGASQLLIRERRGTEVFSVCISDDLAAAGEEYDAFIRTIVSPGTREMIRAGLSPLKP